MIRHHRAPEPPPIFPTFHYGRDIIDFQGSVDRNVEEPTSIGPFKGYLDGPKSTDNYSWYHNVSGLGYWDIAAGSSNVVLEQTDPQGVVTEVNDSPKIIAAATDATGHLLEAISEDDHFHTELAMTGTYINGGIPISLSTAEWYVKGSASTPNPVTLSQVLTTSSWDQLEAAVPASPLDYQGDDKIKFLNWNGNANKVLSQFNIDMNAESYLGRREFISGSAVPVEPAPSFGISPVSVGSDPLRDLYAIVPMEVTDVIPPWMSTRPRKASVKPLQDSRP